MCDNVCWCAVRSQMVQCNMYSVHVASGVCLNMLCHRNTILRSENFKCDVLCSLEQVSLELLISMPWKFTTVSHITYIQYSTLSPPARVVAMQCRRLCAAGPDDHLSYLCSCRYIKLTSPLINVVMCVGALLFYATMVLLGVPTTSIDVQSALCNVSTSKLYHHMVSLS